MRLARRSLAIPPPRPAVVDAAFAFTMLAAAWLSAHFAIAVNEATRPYRAPGTAAVVAGLATVTLPLALRRRAPVAALAACVGGFVVARVGLDSIETSVSVIALGVAFYSAAAHGRWRYRGWVCGVGMVVLMTELWWEVSRDAPPIDGLLGYQAFVLLLNLALLVAAWALGSAVQSGRLRAAELAERTVQLEAEREERARRAVFDERVRIARELHDVVAHHVSVMGVQAGAARLVLDREPARAVEALGAIEASSRQAVAELHRLLGFLRQDGESEALAPQPGLRQLESLVAQMADANLQVQLHVDGEPRALSPTLDVSAFRIVQEALTNTLKHARASTAAVTLRYRPAEVEVEVLDDGRPGPVRVAGTGGHGLIGMRERVTLHGGHLSAGPRPEGGFAVRATFPHRGAT